MKEGLTVDRSLTETLKMSLEPEQAYDDNNDVDEAEVGKHRDKVEIELLVRLEVLYVDAVNGRRPVSESTRDE
jgi:hypothetical protein